MVCEQVTGIRGDLGDLGSGASTTNQWHRSNMTKYLLTCTCQCATVSAEDHYYILYVEPCKPSPSVRANNYYVRLQNSDQGHNRPCRPQKQCYCYIVILELSYLSPTCHMCHSNLLNKDDVFNFFFVRGTFDLLQHLGLKVTSDLPIISSKLEQQSLHMFILINICYSNPYTFSVHNLQKMYVI